MARSKSQLLSPTPLMPSQPSFCTFSITSFVTSPLPSWSCQPFVHDSTASGLRPAGRPTCAVSGRGGSAFRGGARRRQAATARARRFVVIGRVEGWSQTARARVRARAGAGLLESAATAAGWCAAQSPPPSPPPSRHPFLQRKSLLPAPIAPSFTDKDSVPPPPARRAFL